MTSPASMPRSALPIIEFIAVACTALLLACADPGAVAGARCSAPAQCMSRLCLIGANGGGTCAQRCMTSMDCSGGDVCGRFDYRGTNDSGVREGAPSEVLFVCRPPLNPSCGTGQACTAPGAVCFGDPGICTQPCTTDRACSSGRCEFPVDACGAAGQCAPQCDDPSECPRGYYCNRAAADTTSHGRCEPLNEVDAAVNSCDAAD